VYQSIDFSHLRSLTVSGKWESFFISDKMRLLRVLDLEDASSVTDGDLEPIAKLLPRLKFLSLRRCQEITTLPDSFGRLRQLQTLDIRHTSIVRLPASITKLQKLQHIRAGSTVLMGDASNTTVESSLPAPTPPEEASTSSPSLISSTPRAATVMSWVQTVEVWARHWHLLPGSRNGGVEVPRGIGEMMALHNVSVIDVSVASGQAILEELKNLTQLRKLGVSGVNRENCQGLCSAISGLAHLQSLSVWLHKNQAGCLDAISSPPEELQSLKLYGWVGKLPAWIKELINLKKLKLQMDMITQDEVDLLMCVPRLYTLCLSSNDFQYGELRFRDWFRQLLVLEIACNFRLKAVTFEPTVMQWLEVLKIRCRDVMSLKFTGLKELSDLREVTLSGSYDDKVKQQLQSQLDEHPREMKPVLKDEPGRS
jgi:Leucine-rich repeat (LRR) protein